MRLWVQSLALLSGLRIQRCGELWQKLPTWLGSGLAVAVAMAVAGSCSSDSTHCLGTSICHTCSPKKKKKRQINLKKKNFYWEFLLWLVGEGPNAVSVRMWVQSLASLSGLMIWHCCGGVGRQL